MITNLIILEDRGAQAPLILAPAEGFRGPSAPFGGLRPLLWGLRPLLEAYGLSQYHQFQHVGYQKAYTRAEKFIGGIGRGHRPQEGAKGPKEEAEGLQTGPKAPLKPSAGARIRGAWAPLSSSIIIKQYYNHNVHSRSCLVRWYNLFPGPIIHLCACPRQT